MQFTIEYVVGDIVDVCLPSGGCKKATVKKVELVSMNSGVLDRITISTQPNLSVGRGDVLNVSGTSKKFLLSYGLEFASGQQFDVFPDRIRKPNEVTIIEDE